MANFAKYSLTDGYLHHWLVAGPFPKETEPLAVETVSQKIRQQPFKELDHFLGEEGNRQWKYYISQEDHWIDLSDQPGQEGWAALELHCTGRETPRLMVSSFGPAQVWLSNQQRLEIEPGDGPGPHHLEQEVTLNQGRNLMVLRFSRAQQHPRLLAAAVRFTGLSGALVMLPVASPLLSNRKDLEKAFANAYLDRYIYAEKDPVTVRWQKDYPNHVKLAIQFGRGSSAAFIGYNPEVIAGAETENVITHPYEVPDGRYNLRLMPNLEMYGEKQLRIQREIPLYSAKSRFFTGPEEQIGERVDEAVAYAIQRVDDFFGQAIKMAAGRWQLVDFDLVERHLDQVERSPLVELGLANILLRYGQESPFPAALRERLADSLANTEFAAPSSVEGEGDELCLLTRRLLALLNPAGEGQTSRAQARRVGKETEAWIRQRLEMGFRDWNDSRETEKIIFALTLLIDFAGDEGLKEYAGVMLDKLFFHLAVHQLRGAPGTPRRRTALPYALSARFDPLVPLTRLMWGLGAPNPNLVSAAALLSVRGYRLPELIHQIALNEVECLMMERHTDPVKGEEANIVTCKTTDYLLSSVQDYCPGQVGHTELPWQATLSADAVVFTSHPLRFSISEEGLPNFWCGNHSLPRVAQWQNTLMAVYSLPERDMAGFTHAYFPAHAFDEYQFTGGWAFARKGSGYLALTAAQGLEWITTGPSAFRELRSPGQMNTWVCQMGRAARDGSFAEFIEKVLGSVLQFTTEGAVFQPVGAGKLSFGWSGPLLLDDQEVALRGFPHYDTPYTQVEMPAQQMEIRLGDESIRLNFA